MGGWINGWMEGGRKGVMDGWMDGQTTDDRWMDGQINRWMDGWTINPSKYKITRWHSHTCFCDSIMLGTLGGSNRGICRLKPPSWLIPGMPLP